MPVRARLRAAVAALGLTAALVTIPVEAAHADSCPNPIPLSVSDVVLRVNTGMGRHVDHTIGKIYLSYIGGTCRQQFAEIHWNTGAERASGTLYINDPFNSEVGRVPFNVQANYTGYTTSGGSRSTMTRGEPPTPNRRHSRPPHTSTSMTISAAQQSLPPHTSTPPEGPPARAAPPAQQACRTTTGVRAGELQRELAHGGRHSAKAESPTANRRGLMNDRV